MNKIIPNKIKVVNNKKIIANYGTLILSICFILIKETFFDLNTRR